MVINKVVGIDPDLKLNGVAYFENGKLEWTRKMSFFELCDFLKSQSDCLVLIEAGWLIKKRNWHLESWAVEKRERVAYNVGMNHAIGLLLAEFCKKENIPYELVKPVYTKLNRRVFEKLVGIDVKSQEERDAVMLVKRTLSW